MIITSAAAMPQAFWSWAKWKDAGSKGWLPADVRRYYLAHHITKAPLTWQARYAIHKGYKPPPPPPPGPIDPPQAGYSTNPLAAIFRYAGICAEEPMQMANTPPKYGAWLTVDPAYAQSRWIADKLRETRTVGVWGNPLEIGRDRFFEYADQMGVPHDHIMGQAETAGQFERSWEYGLKCVIGNLSSLTGDQLARVKSGEMLFIQEDYWNVMPWLQVNFYNVQPVSMCHGIYPGQVDSPTYGRYLDPNGYINAGRWLRWDGFYHANGPASAGRPQDIAQLP